MTLNDEKYNIPIFTKNIYLRTQAHKTLTTNMEAYAETDLLRLRKIEQHDKLDLFEMDSDPDVHLYIENNPVKTIEEVECVIEMIRDQYVKNGIGRWAVIEKNRGECIGWAGLKYFDQPLNHHCHFYELGYRFKKKHWGKGYATEASRAIIDYATHTLGADVIYAITDPRNDGSKHVLEKLGFEHIEVFDYEGDPTDWYRLKIKGRQATI